MTEAPNLKFMPALTCPCLTAMQTEDVASSEHEHAIRLGEVGLKVRSYIFMLPTSKDLLAM